MKGSLVWTIYRFDDGPMRAYKNLGEDLKLRTPVSANDKLVSISNAFGTDRIFRYDILPPGQSQAATLEPAKTDCSGCSVTCFTRERSMMIEIMKNGPIVCS